jgi:hypothetical protein
VLLLLNREGAGNKLCTDLPLSQINNFKNCVVSDVSFMSLQQTLPAAPQQQRTIQLTHWVAMHEPTQLEHFHATIGLCVKPKLGKAQIPELCCLTTHKVILSTILNF